MQLKAFTRLITLTLFLTTGAVAAKPIPIDSLARLPAINSVSMSADGKQLVALVAKPGSDYKDTALATWDLDNMDKGPIITPSGDRMKFIGASALKSGRLLVFARQEYTGPLSGCGEGKNIGSTATFVNKVYLTDAKHSEFKEAFTEGGSRRFGISERMEKCLEIAGSAGLVSTLPLDPTKVIIQRANGLTLRTDYFRYDLESGDAELVLRGGQRTSPGLIHPRDGKVLTRNELESIGTDDYEQRILILDEATGEFDVHDPLTTILHERYSMNVVGIDDASGKFYVLTDKFSDRVQAWMYDPKTRKFDSELLVGHPKFSIGGLIFGNQPSNFNQVLGFTVAGPKVEVTWVDSNFRSIYEGLKKTYPEKNGLNYRLQQ